MEVLAVALVLGTAMVPLVIPLFRPPLLALRSASGSASRMRALQLRKDSIYGAIREVGFDLRTGKVDQGDYDQQVAVLKREAVEVVGEIEDLKTRPPRGTEEVERAIAAVRKGTPGQDEIPQEAPPDPGSAKKFCTRCGHAATADDLFCAKCGAALEASE